MKVLAFIEATVVNGAAKSLLNLCEAAKQHEGGRKLQFELATFKRCIPSTQGAAAMESTEFAKAVQDAGLQLHLVEESGRFDASTIGRIRDLVRRTSPDVVQTNNVKSHFLLRMAGVRNTRPMLAVHHGYTITDWKMRAYNLLDRYSLRGFDQVVTVCEPFRQALIAGGVAPERVHVVHNSIGLLRTSASDGNEAALRKTLRLEPDDRVMLSVGRFSQEKGHSDLLGAFAQFHASHTSQTWKLLLVGSGPEEERLQDLANRLQVSERVIFAGQQRDVMPFYQIADLFVLPSYSEGSPHVLLEAMQSRVPIVSTAVGGVPEILDGPNSAFLVPPHNGEVLAQAMTRLMQNDKERSRVVEHNVFQVAHRFSHAAYLHSMFRVLEATQSARRLG